MNTSPSPVLAPVSNTLHYYHQIHKGSDLENKTEALLGFGHRRVTLTVIGGAGKLNMPRSLHRRVQH